MSVVTPAAAGSVGTSASNTDNRVVMINFDEGYKSQFLYAKPILDQYGFKASFFYTLCQDANGTKMADLAANNSSEE